MQGFIRGFVFFEAGGVSLKNVSHFGNLGTGESIEDYCLTSRVDGYKKRFGRECSIDCGREIEVEKAQGSAA